MRTLATISSAFGSLYALFCVVMLCVNAVHSGHPMSQPQGLFVLELMGMSLLFGLAAAWFASIRD